MSKHSLTKTHKIIKHHSVMEKIQIWVLNESTLKNKTHTMLYKPDDKLMGNKIFRQTFFMMVLEKKYMRKEKFEMTNNKKGNYLLSNYPFTT